MKKWIALLLAAALLAATPAACALTGQEALDKVSGYLTEVYGYTPQQAQDFQATATRQDQGWLIRFASAQHPEWMYTAIWEEGRPGIREVQTPFQPQSGFQAYPGESAVREGLNRAKENGWFASWNAASLQALKEYMAEAGITPCTALAQGLALENIGAGTALHEYFVSCYGDENGWTKELRQWHDAELAIYGLAVQEEQWPERGVVTWDQTFGAQTYRTVRFVEAVPAELKQAFAHPRLEGWNCLCGAIRQTGTLYGFGLAVFEKPGERLLLALRCDQDSAAWTPFPVSRCALYTDRPVYVQPDDGLHEMTLVYQNSETETERLTVSVTNLPENAVDASLSRYIRMDQASGSGFALRFDHDIRGVTYENHQPVCEEQLGEKIPRLMSLLEMEAFPATMEDWKNAPPLIPEGYAMISGVHLRQKTSSRSRDLGEYNPGVLVKVLGEEPGDPYAWVRVQVGRAQGYMSSCYVVAGSVTSRTLPVARARKEIPLKSATGWLSSTVQRVPQGTLMHVLAQCPGGWLHVSIPRDNPGLMMDPDGVDGYVRKRDVVLGATPLALEWMD